MSSPKELLTAFFHIFFVAIALVMYGYWVFILTQSPEPSEWQKDWHCLWSAGDAFLRGETADLYTTVYKPTYEESVCLDGFFWLYPPYALYFTAGLGLFSPWNAFLLINVAILVGFGLCVYWIDKLYPDDKAGLIELIVAAVAEQED